VCLDQFELHGFAFANQGRRVKSGPSLQDLIHDARSGGFRQPAEFRQMLLARLRGTSFFATPTRMAFSRSLLAGWRAGLIPMRLFHSIVPGGLWVMSYNNAPAPKDFKTAPHPVQKRKRKLREPRCHGFAGKNGSQD